MRRKLYEFPLWALEALMLRLSEAEVLLKLDNWPADARVVAAHVDPVRQRVLLTVDSDSFPDVPIGGLLYVESPVLSYRTLPAVEAAQLVEAGEPPLGIARELDAYLAASERKPGS